MDYDPSIGGIADIQAQRGDTFERELKCLINRYSQENASNTPDFIIAQFLLGCLAAWNQGVQQRETWYGRDARPSGGSGPVPIDQPAAGRDGGVSPDAKKEK
jgi:hypothetical protein